MKGLDAWLTAGPPESPEPDSMVCEYVHKQHCYKWTATYKGRTYEGEIDGDFARSDTHAEETAYEAFLDQLADELYPDEGEEVPW